MKLLSRICVLLTLSFAALTAQAFEKEPFTQDRFEELQAAGEVVLVDVFATWCPTCAKQQNAIAAYAEANPDNNFHVLIVDFDDDKDLVRKFRAPRQSTLLLYKGSKQVWFSVAESRPEVIAAELDKAINSKSKS